MQTVAPQAPTPLAAPALPQNVSRPMTRQDVLQLQNRRSELSRQLSSATGRRSDVVRDIGRTPNGREGLEARLKVLDERIVQLEKDISQNGQLLASAPPNLVEETTPAPIIGRTPYFVNYTAVSIVFTVLVLFPMTLAWVRRQFRRPAPAPELSRDATERLGRIENAVEAIALEVERVSEGQRFVTKLMNENRQLGAGAAEPIVVRQADQVPLARND
ncbi:MAG: hypothetical protein ACYC3L_17220 [Gemmatimonadaceae bacterium]